MTNQIEYKILTDESTFRLKHVQEFIEEQDASFKPKISTKVSIPEYAEKLYTNGKIITCESSDVIIGLSAFYCQPKDYEYSFLSYLAVNNSYRGKGIAKQLISMMIDFCKKQNMKGIKTSTWKDNRAVGLYLSFGFKIIETTSTERVELILIF